MKRLLQTTGAALGLLLLAQTAQAADQATPDTSLEREVSAYLDEVQGGAEDPTTFRMFWKEGLRGETSDGMFKIKIFGRLMVDSFWVSSDDFDSEVTADGVFFRRVRLGMEGEVYKHMLFKVQVDFAKGDEVELKDVFMGLKNLPVVGEWLVGHFKEPFGLEELTSSKYITFIERSGPTNAFAPSRHTGTQFSNTVGSEDRVLWAIGLFRNSDDAAGGSVREDGGYNLTFRIAAFFLEDPESKRIVHVGFGLSYRDPQGEEARFRARFGPGTGDRLVDTGDLTADSLLLWNFELAMTWHSFHAALEFFAAEISAPSGSPEPSFTGWYVEVGYWITGEARTYKGHQWGRTKPRKNFHNSSGPGGWQVAFRYDTLDLTDGAVTGGVQDNLTFGVNWHMNPNARVMFNIVFTDLSDGANGDLTSFITRFQFDF